MKKTFIVFSLAFIAVILIYSFGSFGNAQSLDNQRKGSNTTLARNEAADLTWQEFENSSLRHLGDSSQNYYNSIGESQNKEVFEKKANFWRDNKHIALYGHYIYNASKLDKSEKSLNFATPLLIEILRQEGDPAVKSLISDDILSLCEIGNDSYASNSEEWDYYEAVALIQGKNETMQGVQKLLAISRENPKNIEANLLLAQLALESGQNDKAITRLNDLLEIYPKNTEAMFFLAEAYKQDGEIEKAKEWFEKCKKEVNDPDFTAEIDDYIKTF